MPEDFNYTIRGELRNFSHCDLCEHKVLSDTRYSILKKQARVKELEKLEQNDSDNLRNENGSPNVVRALRRASAAFSNKFRVLYTQGGM